MNITRTEIANHVVKRLQDDKNILKHQWQTADTIQFCYLDDLLPEEIAVPIHAAFPSPNKMTLNKSLRELKFIAAQMNHHHPLLEEAIYAFQDPRVVAIVEEITALKQLEPDTLLYAGGISMMGQNHFLNPHLDNSHDKTRERYRVLNLLYYVTPDWQLKNGGNLELWPKGPKAQPITIESKFNRLAIMITNKVSWHSVSQVKATGYRCCVSNYYFSKYPADIQDYFHVTSFRGRPEEKLRDLALRADAFLRMAIRKVFPQGVKQTKHFYKKDL